MYLFLKLGLFTTSTKNLAIHLISSFSSYVFIFFISLPSVGLVMCIVSGILMGPDLARVGIKLESIITGIFVLCLTQAFSYGMELENDVDGLV